MSNLKRDMNLDPVSNSNRKSKWDELYPENPSLSSEFRRLFKPITPYRNVLDIDIETNQLDFNVFQINDVADEFKCNGVDYDDIVQADKQKREWRPIFKVSQQLAPSQNKLKKKSQRECVFCVNNGEMKGFCQSHLLKDRNGKVICPVLRAYVCPICGASGDAAHTLKYCPKNRNKEQLMKVAKPV